MLAIRLDAVRMQRLACSCNLDDPESRQATRVATAGQDRAVPGAPAGGARPPGGAAAREAAAGGARGAWAAVLCDA